MYKSSLEYVDNVSFVFRIANFNLNINVTIMEKN